MPRKNITEYVPIGLTHFQDDVIDNIEGKNVG